MGRWCPKCEKEVDWKPLTTPDHVALALCVHCNSRTTLPIKLINLEKECVVYAGNHQYLMPRCQCGGVLEPINVKIPTTGEEISFTRFFSDYITLRCVKCKTFKLWHEEEVIKEAYEIEDD